MLIDNNIIEESNSVSIASNTLSDTDQEDDCQLNQQKKI